eukprot:11167482-Alexandrium_andersonii.AAC.1
MPRVCGVRLGSQCIRTWDVPLGVAFASGISAPALGNSRWVWRSPRASVHLHLGCPVAWGVRLGHQCIGARNAP